jgi:hypothetical protein
MLGMYGSATSVSYNVPVVVSLLNMQIMSVECPLLIATTVQCADTENAGGSVATPDS